MSHGFVPRPKVVPKSLVISENRCWAPRQIVTSRKMSTSPTPEEREKKDAEAKAREAEEQAKLPYKWTQSIGDVDITIPVPGNLKGRDLDVVLAKKKIKAGVKGQAPIMDVCNQPQPYEL